MISCLLSCNQSLYTRVTDEVAENSKFGPENLTTAVLNRARARVRARVCVCSLLLRVG